MRLRAGTLDDLDVVDTEIEIRRPDGRVVDVPVRSLTQLELLEERGKVAWPTPPARMIGGGKSGKPQLVKDFEDEGYLRAMEEANMAFTYRILLRCLRLTVPGDTDEERFAALRARLGAWALVPLGKALATLHGVSEADLANAAKN